MTDIYRQAVETFGAEKQLRMVQEECGELVAAVNQHLRGRTVLVELADEIADVEIMCAQARVIIGKRLVEEAKREKLARLAGRIELAQIEAAKVAPVAPVCSRCNDTHRVTFDGQCDQPCTYCPTPCEECGAPGPYCATTPCACSCHVKEVRDA